MTESPINLDEAYRSIESGRHKQIRSVTTGKWEVLIECSYLESIVKELVAARERIVELETECDEKGAAIMELQIRIGAGGQIYEERIAELEGRPKEGLYGKYAIRKTDGSPIDPKADYFILRLDTDNVARIAAREYALHTADKALGEALLERVTKHFVEYIESDEYLKDQDKTRWPVAEIRRLKKQHGGAIIPQADDADSLHFMLDYLRDDPNDNRDFEIEIAKDVLHRYLTSIGGDQP